MEQLDFHAPVVSDRLGKNNQWIKLREKINWEKLRLELSELNKTSHEHGGRPPYDIVSMFKVIVLGQWHDLSDEELEHSLRVRLDFMEFTGFTLSGSVPDKNTIQLYRQKMQKVGLFAKCFKILNLELERVGLKVKSGKLAIDSTIIESAARPRNEITPGDGEEPPTKSSSVDPDAKWTVKGNNNYFGYKEHALVDVEQGFIEDLEVT